MQDYQLLIDFHRSADRQGPGGNSEAEKALNLARIDRARPLKIADIGCGTGASTLLLARLLEAQITWLTSSRPPDLQQYWEREYPEIDVASSKIGVLEKNGYSPIGYFVLPEHCWLENYYRPMQNRFEDFLSRNGHSEEARAIVEAENREIELYEQYKSYYSYGVYIARRLE